MNGLASNDALKKLFIGFFTDLMDFLSFWLEKIRKNPFLVFKTIIFLLLLSFAYILTGGRDEK